MNKMVFSTGGYRRDKGFACISKNLYRLQRSQVNLIFLYFYLIEGFRNISFMILFVLQNGITNDVTSSDGWHLQFYRIFTRK